MRKRLVPAILAASVLLACRGNAVPGLPEYVSPPTAIDHHRDFDFEFGTWRTHYRLLRHRLANNHDWYDCYGTSVIRPFWNGYGNLEDGDLQCAKRYIGGLTARLYNPATHMWSLWWGTKKLGIVPPPQIGHFDSDGVGRFYAPDIQEGRHVIIRFQWTVVNGNPHFEQAFTTDLGKTWETNWTTDYERASPSSKGVWNAQAPSGDGHDGFAFARGSWTTHAGACSGSAAFTPFWGGAATLEDDSVTCPNRTTRGVGIYLYIAAKHEWQLWSGNQNTGLLESPPHVGTFDAGGTGTFYARAVENGYPVVVRQAWKALPGDRISVEDACSADRGKTWRINRVTAYNAPSS